MATFFLVQFLISSALLMGVSIPLIQRKIPRNGLYGFRMPKTLASDEVWYPANEYSGRQMLGAGAAMAAGAILLFLIPGVGNNYALYPTLYLFILFGALGVAFARSFRYLETL